ncbi:MAG: radical SAM protein [Oscillospiraceae bacterium]|nr:radical SAM protein [Oscillospiraceae bacterium]
MKHSNISIFIPHRGCPNCCSFCNQRTISSTAEAPSAEAVTDLLAKAVPELRYPENTEIAFFGGSFTAIERSYMISLLEAASPFVKKLAGIRISTRPDCIDDEVLGILKKYGVTSIELGAQSMRDSVLSANDRGHTAENVRRAAEKIKEHGFSLGLQMMTGLYTSSLEDDIYTAEEIIRLKPDTVRIYPVVILGGTKLADLYQSGVYKTVSLNEMTELCAKLLLRFEEENIKVIRLGLHSSDSVEGEAVGGYYHPAFRELCLGVIFRKIIEEKLKNKGSYTVYVSPRSLSMAAGQKKCNIAFFAEKGVEIKIKADTALKEREIRIEESKQN